MGNEVSTSTGSSVDNGDFRVEGLIPLEQLASDNHSQGEMLEIFDTTEQNDRKVFRDPVLDAVATVVRKGQHEQSRRIRQQQNSQRIIPVDNEWKKSLQRLAKTAASTAKTVAHVTAPVITDAKQVVVSAATEFAHDVQKEWEKGNEILFVNDEETVSKNDKISNDVDNTRPLVVKKSAQDGNGASLVFALTSSQSSKKSDYEISTLNEEEKDEEKTVVVNMCEEKHKSNAYDNGCIEKVSKNEVELKTQSDRPNQINTAIYTKTTMSPQTRNINESSIDEVHVQSNDNIRTMSAVLHFDEKKGMSCLANSNAGIETSSLTTQENCKVLQKTKDRTANYSGTVSFDILNAAENYRSNIKNDMNDTSSIIVSLSENEMTEKDFDAVPPNEISFCKNGSAKQRTEMTKTESNQSQPLNNAVDIIFDGAHKPTDIKEKVVNNLVVDTTTQDEAIDICPLTIEETWMSTKNDEIGKAIEFDGKLDILKKETYNIKSFSRITDNNKIDKTLRRFERNESLIYENEEIDKVQVRNDIGTNFEFDNHIPKLQPEQASYIPSWKENIFEDKKSIVKYVVTKLTGFDIEVKEKTCKFILNDPTLSIDYPVIDSIFDKQMNSISASSSLSSPPEIQACDQINDKDSGHCSTKGMDDHISLFDFVPAKREISRESDKDEEDFMLRSNGSQERADDRTVFKQGSAGSMNDSLDSMSTQQNSFNSMPFSTSSRRPNRRLRRHGSKMSLKSLINTKSARARYETSVENRSLVDDKQIDLNSIEHGGQMVRWDCDAEAIFPSVPDTEEMTEAIERSELFHETLMAFSSLENLEFLEDFPHRKSSGVSKTMASLMWRQLVANWKHSESCKAILTRLSSIPMSNLVRQTGLFDDEDSSSTSTIRFRFNAKNVTFSNDFVSGDAYLLLRNVHDNCYDGTHEDFLVLTRFLCDIGPSSSLYGISNSGYCSAKNSSLRHDFKSRHESNQHGGIPKITDIQKEAKAQLSNLEIVIDYIVQYSTHNDLPYTDTESNGVFSSVGIKDYSSIREKATRKYDGDVLQVKDVLRGEITFPDEGSLICGLYCLHNLAKHNGNSKKIGIVKSIPSFEIARLKNLFRTTRAGSEFYHALPTGYRHILINLRLKGGLIAELQFQIAQIFGVMGAGGYLLHRDIVLFESEKGKESITRNADTQVSNEKNGSLFSVSTSDFVNSIFTIPAKLLNVSLQQRIHHIDTTDELDTNVIKVSTIERTTKPTQVSALSTRKSEDKSTDEDPQKASVGVIVAIAAQADLKINLGKQLTKEAPKPNLMEENENSIDDHSITLVSAIFEAGILEAVSNPRHLPAFYCLHLLVTCMQQRFVDLPTSRRENEASPSELSTFSRRLLLRSLAISNQATSTGMIGWLEYGSSNPFDRALDLPFEALQQLACNMAAKNDWTKASDVLSSLLIRCERDLPPYHHTTLSAMLDLAGALTETKEDIFAKSIISRLLDSLSSFLSEAESLFFDRHYYEVYHKNNPNEVVMFDDCVDAVGIMQAFATNFHKELSRNFAKLLGSNHRICLLNHSLVADSFSVLANCISASEEINSKTAISKINRIPNEHDTSTSLYFWSLAYSQYDIALRGWTKVESLIHPNAASIALSIARCLRELGNLTQALRILETLCSCLEQKLDEMSAAPKTTTLSSSDHNSILMDHYQSSSSPIDRLPFISRRHVTIYDFDSPSTLHQVITFEREQSTVLCLWMIAILTVEQSPDERGRIRALSLLHTASLTLQRALNSTDNFLDDQTRMIFLDLYEKIEGEALAIFEPLKKMPSMDVCQASSINNKSQKMVEDISSSQKSRAPCKISTPMRERRQWTTTSTSSGNASNFTDHNINRYP